MKNIVITILCFCIIILIIKQNKKIKKECLAVFHMQRNIIINTILCMIEEITYDYKKAYPDRIDDKYPIWYVELVNRIMELRWEDNNGGSDVR